MDDFRRPPLTPIGKAAHRVAEAASRITEEVAQDDALFEKAFVELEYCVQALKREFLRAPK
jgi:hypothetical protein